MIDQWNKTFANKQGFTGAIQMYKWIEESEYIYSDWNIYHKHVWKLTENVAHLIPNIELRGWENYHIDHIISIYEGFNKSIPIERIGSLSNLRMLPYKENMRKSTKYILTEIEHCRPLQ